ncbi:dihydrodipicolinate synthase family protein [Mycobacterium sp. M1]|uniref:Dihydrodipicolinate synthase family protein n=1 Tax=Mycolicibacter acidiphilus TaxID=2835306 RepID=A0ABS5RKH0_9MYCO|nr:dihydrodipicolinate synthase family protein [Mycolicibacter acidiphilus]MBS9534098.1 dihydrodipicolinate synthase family protein [Mycolicibacter acidiphilus]
MDFTGLCAFPPTPLTPGGADEDAFRGIIGRLADAGVDSICALGSTGHYAYLPVAERVRLTAAAVDAAGSVPVLTSVGALSTDDVLTLTEAVQAAGVAGVLLAPVSYQPLTRAEVLGLYTDVTAELTVPLCVYDNPVTTGFTFDDELLAEIAALPNVASVKIPGAPVGDLPAGQRAATLRKVLPAHVTIGVSGDPFAVDGLLAGCDAWYSVIAGLLPAPALALLRAASSGDAVAAREISASLQSIWRLYADYGSARVAAAIAGELGLADSDFLPRPLRPIDEAGRVRVRAALSAHQ